MPKMTTDALTELRLRRLNDYYYNNPEKLPLRHKRKTPAINSAPRPDGYTPPKKEKTVVDKSVREGRHLHVSIYNAAGTRVVKRTYTVTKVTPTGLVRTDKGDTFKLNADKSLGLHDKWMKDLGGKVTCNVI